MATAQSLAWFFTPSAKTLWIGVSGLNYGTTSFQICEVRTPTTEEGCDVLMKQIYPYYPRMFAEKLIDGETITRLVSKQYFTPDGLGHSLTAQR